jgi:TolA-binding protein
MKQVKSFWTNIVLASNFYQELADSMVMKSRNNLVFVVFCLILLVGLVQLHWYFQDYFGESRDLVSKVSQLKHDLEQQRLQTALIQNQFRDFQQDVASLLPRLDKKSLTKVQYKVSQMAQVLRQPASENVIDTSSVLMARARDEFSAKHFDRAATLFKEVIKKYPVSSQIVDAYFLLGESLYQSEQYDECLNVAYEMVNQFPQNQMTGYLLLRNGQILSMRKRVHEAAEVYDIVSTEFSGDKQLADQARRLALAQ